MILYPSGESKTQYRTPAWAALIIIIASTLAYLFVYLPAEKAQRLEKQTAMRQFYDILEKDRGEGLRDSYYEQVQQNPQIVLKAEFDSIFSNRLQSAYQRYQSVTMPLVTLERSIGFKRLFLAMIPHHFGLMLLGFFCLFTLAHLFEHLYDRPLLVLLFVLVSLCWFFIGNLIPETYQPSPIFAWSYTMAVLMISMWLVSPKASIYLTFRTWFIKVIDIKFELPSLLFVVLYCIALVAVQLLANPYADYFNPLAMSAIPILSLLLLIPLSFMPTKKAADVDMEEFSLNQQIAVAENLMTQERQKEAMELLRDLLDRQPHVEQIERIADLAWRNHDNALAKQGYMAVFREAFNSRDFHKVLNVMEILMQRDIPIPANALTSIIRMAIQNNQLKTVRRLMPLMFENKAISQPTKEEVMEGYVKRLTQQADPDRIHINELQDTLSKKLPDSRAHTFLNAYIHRSIESSMPAETFGFAGKIHKYVRIKLLEINDERLEIQVGEGKRQHAPWTAIMGIFCCYQTGEDRGYHGCVLLRFQRKVFACSFNVATIAVTDAGGRTLTFEETWQLLKENVPEGLPLSELNGAVEVENEDAFKEALTTFMKEQNL